MPRYSGRIAYARKPVDVPTEPMYCAICGKTQPHEKKDDAYVCHGCGSEKKLKERLAEALGILEDSPVIFKAKGLKCQSGAGAHRPDKGVKYTELKFDDQFKTKADYYDLR